MKILKTKVKLSKLKWRYRVTALFCVITIASGVWFSSPVIFSALSTFAQKMALSSAMFALPSGTLYVAEQYYNREDIPDDIPEYSEPSSSETVSESEITSSDTPISAPVSDVPISRRGKIEEITYLSSMSANIVKYGAGAIKNDTKNSTSAVEKILSEPFEITLDDGPQVLIMHTHTTESYEPYARDYFDSDSTSRTTDNNNNMAKVGEVLCEVLNSNGIYAIHDTTQHDYPSYNGSYERSAETVKAYLKKYPSIKIVLDIHRDAIERENGTRIKPVTEINGKKAAQLMIISGCDDGKMNMPKWRENLKFSAALQDQLESDYPTLTRPILFCYRKYNQDLTTGSILIEVGGHANSIDEALYSARLLGESLSRVLNKK